MLGMKQEGSSQLAFNLSKLVACSSSKGTLLEDRLISPFRMRCEVKQEDEACFFRRVVCRGMCIVSAIVFYVHDYVPITFFRCDVLMWTNIIVRKYYYDHKFNERYFVCLNKQQNSILHSWYIIYYAWILYFHSARIITRKTVLLHLAHN